TDALSELRAVGDRRAKNLAGCDVRDAVAGGDPLRLGSLAPPLWAQKEYPHRSRSLFQEAFVGAHHHLRLHLPHGVERDSDDDEHGRSAERTRARLREAAVA